MAQKRMTLPAITIHPPDLMGGSSSTPSAADHSSVDDDFTVLRHSSLSASRRYVQGLVNEGQTCYVNATLQVTSPCSSRHSYLFHDTILRMSVWKTTPCGQL